MSRLVFIILISYLSSFLGLMSGLLGLTSGLSFLCLSSPRLNVNLVPMLKPDDDTNILLL